MENLAASLTVAQRRMLADDPIAASRHGPDLDKWPEDVVRELLAAKMALPWMLVEPTFVDQQAFRESSIACRDLRFLPAYRGPVSLHVFMTEPFDGSAIRRLRNLFHREIHPIGTSRRAMERTLSWLEGRSMTVAQSPVSASDDEPQELLSWRYSPEEGVDFVRRLLHEAYRRGASDVFMETYPDRLDIRFNIGVCVVMPPIDPRYAGRVISDVKAFGSMSTRDTRGYRDGSAEMTMDDGNILNFRVVAQRALSGETVTIRLLDKTVVTRGAGELPFVPRYRDVMHSLIQKGQGLIIACGPTGSGKSTLLWRMMLSLDSSEKKIVTIEDPVEYRFDRFVQLPVKGEKSEAESPENFPDALRSCLRAAPNVILVGEMRDSETAKVAVRAGLTGHLIFSSLHAPDSVGVIPRLMDMDVSPLNVRQTLLAVIAQRLGRRLCPHCRVEVPVTPGQAEHYAFYQMPVPKVVARPGACPRCKYTGFDGRIAVQEVLVISPELRSMITGDFREEDIRAHWITHEHGQSLAMRALELAGECEISYDYASSQDTVYVPRARG